MYSDYRQLLITDYGHILSPQRKIIFKNHNSPTDTKFNEYKEFIYIKPDDIQELA